MDKFNPSELERRMIKIRSARRARKVYYHDVNNNKVGKHKNNLSFTELIELCRQVWFPTYAENNSVIDFNEWNW